MYVSSLRKRMPMRLGRTKSKTIILGTFALVSAVTTVAQHGAAGSGGTVFNPGGDPSPLVITFGPSYQERSSILPARWLPGLPCRFEAPMVLYRARHARTGTAPSRFLDFRREVIVLSYRMLILKPKKFRSL